MYFKWLCFKGHTWIFKNSKYFVFIVSNHSNLPDIVSKVLSQEMQKIFLNKDLENFNEDFLKRNAASLQHLLSGWCMAPRVKIFMEKSEIMIFTKVWKDVQPH